MSVNKELARVFDQIADLMEIKGEDPFRINSYRRAARSLKDCPHDVAALAEAGRLKEIPGVGKGTAERINQYLKTGQIEVHHELLAAVPAGLGETSVKKIADGLAFLEKSSGRTPMGMAWPVADAMTGWLARLRG